MERLLDYPEDFLKLFTYSASDLSRVETLNFLPEHDDNTYFLSVPPDRYEDAIINLKKSGRLDDFDNSRVVIENLGQDFNCSHLQSVVEKNYVRSRYIALIIILAKILLITYLLRDLVMF